MRVDVAVSFKGITWRPASVFVVARADDHGSPDQVNIGKSQTLEFTAAGRCVGRQVVPRSKQQTVPIRPRNLAETFPLLTEGSLCIILSVTEGSMSKPSDLVQGTLDLLLLKILALQPMNGWAISLRLKSISGDVLQVSEGSLYPALHKLEQEGWITAEWKQTENNRRAKFYSLTRLGRRQLESEAANWQRLSSAISQVIQISEA